MPAEPDGDASATCDVGTCRATGFICSRRSRRLTIRGRGRRARARRLRSLQAEVGHGATLVFFDLRRAPGDGPKQPKQPPPPPLTCSTA